MRLSSYHTNTGLGYRLLCLSTLSAVTLPSPPCLSVVTASSTSSSSILSPPVPSIFLTLSLSFSHLTCYALFSPLLPSSLTLPLLLPPSPSTPPSLSLLLLLPPSPSTPPPPHPPSSPPPLHHSLSLSLSPSTPPSLSLDPINPFHLYFQAVITLLCT